MRGLDKVNQLYVPEELILGKTPIDIQKDMNLPWADGAEDGFWFG